MLKELVVTLAQIVEAGVTIFVSHKSVLGALTMTGELKLAFSALTG